MSDLGEALVSSRDGAGISGLYRYVPTEGYGFQPVYSAVGYKESLGSRETDQLVEDFSLVGKPGIFTQH